MQGRTDGRPDVHAGLNGKNDACGVADCPEGSSHWWFGLVQYVTQYRVVERENEHALRVRVSVPGARRGAG